MTPPQPAAIAAGSHDPLLEWALRESGSGIASLAVGSEAGYARFLDGEVVVAAMHLHALEDIAADTNVAALSDRGDVHDAVLVAFCRREQGLLVASGNPKSLTSIADVATRRARLAVRPTGAGAQLLLLALLHRAGKTLDAVDIGPLCATGPDIAQAIRAGRADVGVATRAVALSAGLDFVPIVWEPFDLAMRQRDYFRPALQTLVKFLRTDAFRARAQELGGYDVTMAGDIRYAP
jgi:molybdate-binding protein